MGDENRPITAAYSDEIRRFYEAHSDWVYGYARLLVGRDRRTHDTRTAAEDLLQDTFIAAADSWGTVRALSEVQQRAWLRTTVSRMASSMGRRSQMFRDLMPELYDVQTDVSADPAEQAIGAVSGRLVLEEIVKLIDGLPFQQRMIAIMKWVDHRKNKEIAAELGTSPNVVAVQVNTIRRKLLKAAGARGSFAPQMRKEGTYDGN